MYSARNCLVWVFVVGIAMLFSLPCAAQSTPTLAELQQELDRLSKVESDLLDARESSQRRVSDRDLLLFGGGDGPVIEATVSQMATYIDRLIDRIEVLGFDRVYYDAMSPFEEMIVRGLRDSGMLRDAVLRNMVARSDRIRAQETENLSSIDAMLDEVRATFDKAIALRDALRARVALGDSSPLVVSLDDPGSNPVCLDDSIPLDHRAIYWKIGYGGSGPYPAVKGNYICRGVPWQPYWYDYITESELLRFECAPDDPHNCKVAANYGFKRVYTDDQGRRVHEFQGSDAASVTLYATTE